MSIYILDTETSVFAKGNPYSKRNEMVCVGLKDVKTGERMVFYEEAYHEAKKALTEANILVGFNLKFDLAWLRRYNMLPEKFRVWDCQLWEFLESNQSWRYPDLDTACANKKLQRKLDVVKTEYWDKGVDTKDIPREVLTEYLEGDLDSTDELFQWQLTQKRSWSKLFRLQCEDLLVLQEMEWNGLLLDVDACEQRAKEAGERIRAIEQELSKGRVLPPNFNWDSNDHLSCFLYGGTILVEDRVPVGHYKSGQKIGQVRYKIVKYEYPLAQQIKPNDKYALQKEGYWSTGEDALKSVKTNKAGRKAIELLLERAELAKLLQTYYTGIPKLMEEKDWEPGTIHGQFNQVVAATGRLSATAPNQQNFPPAFKELLVSRYD